MTDVSNDDLPASFAAQEASSSADPAEPAAPAKKARRTRSTAQGTKKPRQTTRSRKTAAKDAAADDAANETANAAADDAKAAEAEEASAKQAPAKTASSRGRRKSTRTKAAAADTAAEKPSRRTKASRDAAAEKAGLELPLQSDAAQTPEKESAPAKESTSAKPAEEDSPDSLAATIKEQIAALTSAAATEKQSAAKAQRDWSSWKGWDDDDDDDDGKAAGTADEASSPAAGKAGSKDASAGRPAAQKKSQGRGPKKAEAAAEAAQPAEKPEEPAAQPAVQPAAHLSRHKKTARGPVINRIPGHGHRELQPAPLQAPENVPPTAPAETVPAEAEAAAGMPGTEAAPGMAAGSEALYEGADSAEAGFEAADYEPADFEEFAGEEPGEEHFEDEGSDLLKQRSRGRRGGRSHKKPGAQPGMPQFTTPPAAAENVKPVHEPAPGKANKRRMFISVLPGEQVEVAFTSNGILDEYYLDMLHQKKIKGNIYRGIIVNIDVNLQAAFVDFGTEKNGFLQIDEVHPEYFVTAQEYVRGRKTPPIQKVLRLGQEVLVQVVKEPNGSKGAFLTTWISLAGRFLVLTPGQEQIAISRKVNDEGERSRLRELMNGIDPGEDLGVIVRTVSAGVTQTTLQNDLAYLKRTWNEVRKHATGVTAPACVYKEPGLVERAVRDYLTDDVYELWVDNADVAERIKNTVALLFPHKKDLVRIHNDNRHSLWERFNLRRQLDQIYSREVLMPSGGRLVFDQTEALMAIDVNSGKISCKGNFEHMSFKTNMEAAETIARQLKLRDVGGQVVIDFIEMKEHKHVQEVERTLRNAMKNDRARHDIQHMSSFGLLELVRQRTATSAISISMEPCPACGGTGLRRNLEWQSLQALRDIARMMRNRSADCCRYEMNQELGIYVLNHKRDALKELETLYGKTIEIAIHP